MARNNIFQIKENYIFNGLNNRFIPNTIFFYNLKYKYLIKIELLFTQKIIFCRMKKRSLYNTFSLSLWLHQFITFHDKSG